MLLLSLPIVLPFGAIPAVILAYFLIAGILVLIAEKLGYGGSMDMKIVSHTVILAALGIAGGFLLRFG